MLSICQVTAGSVAVHRQVYVPINVLCDVQLNNLNI